MVYKVNMQKSNVFLYANNEQLEIKIFKKHQKHKILRVNLTKNV